MKRVGLLLSFIVSAILSASSANLSTDKIAQLAKAKTISAISNLAPSNGYKLAYKKNGAKGYEGYDVTDIAWAYNATYIPSMNGWDYSGNFSAIKLLYNNRTKQPESIVYVVSDGAYFHSIKNQITAYGYTFYQENTSTFNNAVAYCYYNDSLKMYAIFAEYYGNGGYQIHFYHAL